jgi:RNA recognition motif-containing protein
MIKLKNLGQICVCSFAAIPVKGMTVFVCRHGSASKIYEQVRKEEMETKLYVGNLSYNTTDEDLRVLFTQSGTVKSVEVIKDRDSGRSKGFAFVEMSTQAEVESAIKAFNGYSLDSRQLKVSIARPREERPQGGGGWYSDSPRKSNYNSPRGKKTTRRSY